ncbi:MAG: hypothetical protein OSJ45_04030 [Lachnospiraceae bacterium]|nr:hypothetical protein [Lachnospiraceae bacterium]
MADKKTTDTQTTEEKDTQATNSVKNTYADGNPSKEEKTPQTANMDDTEEAFIYIGPTTYTGLIENTIVKGTRESVEDYLKDAIKEIPQIKALIVPVESLARNKAKIKQPGTLLNKYYNDILSLRGKAKKAKEI